MMGRQSRQTAMIFVDIESLIPETHLLRKIERMVSFDFIYDLLAPYYPATGRPSVGPVSMFKMLLIGYLYGIKSERRLVEEVQLNIAYRWFCGFELDDTIPNHSTFSKTRTRKWQQSSLFQKAFYEIVKQCIDSGLIDGEAMAADGSYIPANVSRESWINVETEVEQSMQSYPDNSHVGIICGRDEDGSLLVIHCASGANNVVITGTSGFISVARPDYFSDN